MIRSEEKARQACVELIDKLIDFQKKNISGLEIMKEHINDMSSEQFEHFGTVFACVMSPEMLKTTLKSNSVIAAVNSTIMHIKEEN